MNFRFNHMKETQDFGKKIGELLKKGDILLLDGDLGAGKTTFTQGIAKGLGIDSYVKSPTFTYVIEYNGRIPLYHFDLYRLQNPEEIYDLGFDDYLEQGVLVMEWGALAQELLQQEHIPYIKITIDKTGENQRELKIVDTARGKELTKELE
ncbi:tRNA (adenosine(37)-N6)-threonylcarbamoyltransferase complex ATPase subunit type 1 TsaE [Alkalicella caledoniensis]|uniref:tRNA threonylcarbamoyladenosine biosynthesis protein TsaE n=1 Tax=Alkalicella caledoniensis TaxID=2731377 RepID=A0A7G9W785_ALKCA|nr:tRNA (adenosine(37)-N6)-threonylcarbamoyltransferase complex ATPase subunit type 1 TsaE [Alkalicella caledoniensis]QNO14547.1 tRNA (adenosine(37)-N6)-threonylcarbamoyltransferase complex ATPase subunit type 1 TsaE [Alkalicella caledoniensis]